MNKILLLSLFAMGTVFLGIEANAQLVASSNTTDGSMEFLPVKAGSFLTSIGVCDSWNSRTACGDPSSLEIKIIQYAEDMTRAYMGVSAVPKSSGFYTGPNFLYVSMAMSVYPLNDSNGVELRGFAFNPPFPIYLVQIQIPDLKSERDFRKYTLLFEGNIVAHGTLKNCSQKYCGF